MPFGGPLTRGVRPTREVLKQIRASDGDDIEYRRQAIRKGESDLPRMRAYEVAVLEARPK